MKNNKIYQVILHIILCVSILMLIRIILTQFYIIKDSLLPIDFNYENAVLFSNRLLILKLVPIPILIILYIALFKYQKRFVVRSIIALIVSTMVFVFFGNRIVIELLFFSNGVINSMISLAIFSGIFLVVYKILKR